MLSDRDLSYYLYPVRFNEVHVQCRCVGKNLPASFHSAEDVFPHFFGQLTDAGFYHFATVRQGILLAFESVCRRRIAGIPLVHRGSGHVSVLKVRAEFAGASAAAGNAQRPYAEHNTDITPLNSA